MSKFRLNMSLEKWIHQNAGEIIDFVEGCLLDNYLISCKNGTAAVLETYLNPNSSGYTVYFSRDYSASNHFYRLTERS